jgi:hypothetical protein
VASDANDVALTVILQHESEENGPFSLEEQMRTVKVITQCIGRYSDRYVRGQLNSLLRGWSAYFSYGTRLMAYRAADHHVYHSVRRFLRRRQKVRSQGTRRFSDEAVHGEYGVLRLHDVHSGPMPTAAR